MASSKLMEITRESGGAAFASFHEPRVEADAMKVISVIGKQNKGKSTLLNQIISSANPFYVNDDPVEARKATTKGLDFWVEEDKIYIDSEGVGANINKQFKTLDHMILLSGTLISNIIILIADYNDTCDSGSFSRKLLSALFTSIMSYDQGKKKLIIVLKDEKIDRFIEEFKDFIRKEIWIPAYEEYLNIRANEERKEEEDARLLFERYFELVVVLGYLRQENDMYDNRLIQRLVSEIGQSNNMMKLSTIKDNLNETVRLFNENAFPDPKTILKVISLIKRVENSIREDCLNQDLHVVARDINLFIKIKRESAKKRILEISNLDETAQRYLNEKLDGLFNNLFTEWTGILICYMTAQIKYYYLKIRCVNLNYIENKQQIYEEEICRLNREFRNSLDSFLPRTDLKNRIIRRADAFIEKIRQKISDSIHFHKKVKIATFSIGTIMAVLTAGAGGSLFLIAEAVLYRSVTRWAIGFLATSGVAWFGALINGMTYNSFDQIRNLSSNNRNFICRQSNELLAEMEILPKELQVCKGSKLLLKIDKEILKESPREFSEIDLESIFQKANPK